MDGFNTFYAKITVPHEQYRASLLSSGCVDERDIFLEFGLRKDTILKTYNDVEILKFCGLESMSLDLGYSSCRDAFDQYLDYLRTLGCEAKEVDLEVILERV